MWAAYKKWFQEYDVSPKIKIDLQKYDLSDQKNVDIVLGQIDDALAKIRQPKSQAL